jgi:hypothetical protein
VNGKHTSNTANDGKVTRASLDKPRNDPTAELLRLHYKFGHISFSRLRAMARIGTLPTTLETCPLPVCPSCLYGKAKRKPTQTKTKKSINPARQLREPGDCVSVDILVSRTPGLIAQTKGWMTTSRYCCACVFVDHWSDFTYVHLLRAQDSDEVLEAKRAFEATADSHGIQIKHYHADNGIFVAKQWINSCRDQHQGMTLAGVDAHHQNGRAERKIQSLQELARCQLIHAAHRWESAITAHLWPYAVRHAAAILNDTPCERLGFATSPLQAFSQVGSDAPMSGLRQSTWTAAFGFVPPDRLDQKRD